MIRWVAGAVLWGLLAGGRAQPPPPAPPPAYDAVQRVWQAGRSAYVCAEPGAPAVTRNADLPLPVASVSKLLLLAAYAVQVADGTLDPAATVPLAALDVLYLPGTDGGAHPAFLDSLPPGTTDVTWAQLAEGTLFYSSNATADLLLAALTPAFVVQVAADVGLGTRNAPPSFLGLYLALANHEDGAVRVPFAPREDVLARAEALAARYRGDAAWRAAERAFRADGGGWPPLGVQHAFLEHASLLLSANQVAALLRAFYDDASPLSGAAQRAAQDVLDWPFDANPALAARFAVFGAKGGSWPFVLADALYAVPTGGTPRLLVVLMPDVPWLTFTLWGRTADQQRAALYVLETGCSALIEAP